MNQDMSTRARSNDDSQDSIQAEIARVISDGCEAWLRSDLEQNMPEFVAALLVPLVRRREADTLRETADDIHFNAQAPDGCTGEYMNGMDDAGDQLFNQLRERANIREMESREA